MSNSFVKLSLFSGNNFTGRRIQIKRGGVAVQNAAAFRFNNELSSFRLQNVYDPNQVTLILFSRTNFRGNIRIFRGSQSIARLSNFNFNNIMSSFILVGCRLRVSEINQIRSTGILPKDVVIIRQ